MKQMNMIYNCSNSFSPPAGYFLIKYVLFNMIITLPFFLIISINMIITLIIPNECPIYIVLDIDHLKLWHIYLYFLVYHYQYLYLECYIMMVSTHSQAKKGVMDSVKWKGPGFKLQQGKPSHTCHFSRDVGSKANYLLKNLDRQTYQSCPQPVYSEVYFIILSAWDIIISEYCIDMLHIHIVLPSRFYLTHSAPF